MGEFKDEDNLYILSKKQLFEIYQWGEDNIDNDGCHKDDSVKDFEDCLEDILKPKEEKVEEPWINFEHLKALYKLKNINEDFMHRNPNPTKEQIEEYHRELNKKYGDRIKS